MHWRALEKNGRKGESSGEARQSDGEIKGARRSTRKPLAWLGFYRAGRSERVPRHAFLAMQSRIFSALSALLRLLRPCHDGGRQRSAYSTRAHSQHPRAETEE